MSRNEFVKLWGSIYDSSLADDWQIRVVFQDFLNLSSASGIVDMTQEAIARRTNVPLEIVKRAITELEKPDPRSRTPDEEGRRIVRLDRHRDWGWRIVNYTKYREAANAEMLRMAEAERKRAYRQKFGKLSPTPPLYKIHTVETKIENSPRHVPDMSRKKAAVPDSLSAPQFMEAWEKWLDHLRQRRKPATAHTQELQLKKLAKMGLERAVAALLHSIERNWQSIYEEKSPTTGRPIGPAPLPVHIETRQLSPEEM